MLESGEKPEHPFLFFLVFDICCLHIRFLILLLAILSGEILIKNSRSLRRPPQILVHKRYVFFDIRGKLTVTLNSLSKSLSLERVNTVHNDIDSALKLAFGLCLLPVHLLVELNDGVLSLVINPSLLIFDQLEYPVLDQYNSDLLARDTLVLEIF